jgi:ABC-type uncharacterized transport system permease subunit
VTPEKDPTHEPPGGVLGAWFNVLVCTGIVVGAVVYMVSQGVKGPDVLIGAAVVIVGIGLDISFIRTLLRQRGRTKE